MARVEAMTPIVGRPLRDRLWQILQVMLADRRQAWEMAADGTYRRPVEGGGDDAASVGTHETLMSLARAEAVVSAEELHLLRCGDDEGADRARA